MAVPILNADETGVIAVITVRERAREREKERDSEREKEREREGGPPTPYSRHPETRIPKPGIWNPTLGFWEAGGGSDFEGRTSLMAVPILNADESAVIAVITVHAL